MKLSALFKLLSQKETETKSRFEVVALVRDSAKAANMKAASAEWLELWIRQCKV